MSRFRNADPYSRTRIDTRSQSDPAVAAGMRNLHRDTRGNVIGGITAEGQALGTKNRPSGGGSATPRLDAGVQTPRLDSNPRQPITYTSTAAIRQRDLNAAHDVTLQGGFGRGAQQKAQNLDGRKSLFREMQTAGRGGITPAMEEQAAKLGVKRSRFRQVAGGLPAAPAAIAAASPAPSPVRSVMNTAAAPARTVSTAKPMNDPSAELDRRSRFYAQMKRETEM